MPYFYRLMLVVIAITGCSNSNSPATLKSTELTQALTTGDAQLIPQSQEIVVAIDDLSDRHLKNQQSVFEQVYGTHSINYPVSRHSQFIQVNELAGSFPVIVGNKGLLLAAASEIKGQRNAAFGSNIISELNNGGLISFEEPFKNLLAWLMNRTSQSLPTQAKVVMLTVSNGTAASSESWIEAHFSNWQVINCNSIDVLNTCLDGADIVLVSTTQNIEQSALNAALNTLKINNTPVLYVHQDSWNVSDFTPTVLGSMGFYMQSKGGPGNYFSQDQAQWDNYQAMQAGSNTVTEVSQMAMRLQNNGFSFDIANCLGNCDEIDLFLSEFKTPFTLTKNLIDQLDKDKITLFSSDGYELEKLLVLLADKYRQEIVYPMDTSTTSTQNFLRAMYADGIVYSHRDINTAQADLGNFSRSDFSHITPVTKTINLISKRSFRSAGVYALPGNSFEVTRLDSSDVTTKVFINTQRPGSTHEFENNGYSRPKYLQSQHIEIKSGETITLTNPYGGPVQIEFSSNDFPVQFEFNNIGLHAFWNGSEDDLDFARALDAGDYDWAELITPGFEVHSQLAKMRESMANENFASAKAISDATMRYIHNFPHVLAGFQGPGIDAIPEIHDFSARLGYSIDTIDLVKHMNADQATCGYGCSGNPYDAYWNFNPVGHGDVHELGHGLEKGRFRFAGWEGHASTNPYSYYTKSQFYKDTGLEPDCQSLPFDELLQTLQDSQLSENPFEYMQSANLTSWNQGVAIYVQMMMAAQHQGVLEDGWHLLARLHIFEREFNRAIKSDEVWLEKRESLGFSLYDLTSAKALNNNDWLTLALSWVSELDYRAFLTLWGLDYSPEISAQLQQHGLEQAVPQFYQASGNDYCYGLDKSPLVLVP